MTTDGILPGKRYHLVNHHQNQGLHLRVHSSWDWVIAASKENDPGEPVIFHEYDEGAYVIESTYKNWGDYRYWKRDAKGIYLAKADSADFWFTLPTTNGFLLYKDEFLSWPGDGGYVNTKGWTSLMDAIFQGQDIEDALNTDPDKRKRVEFKAVPA